MNRRSETSFFCLFLCPPVFAACGAVDAADTMPQRPESAAVTPTADDLSGSQLVGMRVFDHTLANRDHRPIATIELPACKRVVAGEMEITEHLDVDDGWPRATYFLFDLDPWGVSPSGYVIGCERTDPNNVTGDTISPGQTKTFTYDMSYVQFSMDSSGTGSWYKNFIPQDADDTTGYLSPGTHTISAWISSYDKFSGKLPADTWITLDLRLEFEDVIGVMVDEFIDAIAGSEDECWRKPTNSAKSTMIKKLNRVKDLSYAWDCEKAYKTLLRGIKPKLTGLKTDENGQPWATGVFNNPWVVCSHLQEAFASACDEILAELAYPLP